MKKSRLQEIQKGEHRIERNKLLRLDLKPNEIPPLPSGKEALIPKRKQGGKQRG